MTGILAVMDMARALTPQQRTALEAMAVAPLVRHFDGWCHPGAQARWHPKTIAALCRRGLCHLGEKPPRHSRARTTIFGWLLVRQWRAEQT